MDLTVRIVVVLKLLTKNIYVVSAVALSYFIMCVRELSAHITTARDCTPSQSLGTITLTRSLRCEMIPRKEGLHHLVGCTVLHHLRPVTKF